MPKDNVHYAEYKNDFCNMAEALKLRQRDDGMFNSSLDDPQNYGGAETSGTAAFMFGIAAGIRNGILPRDEYMDVLVKGYNGLSTISLSNDGKIGYVQPEAEAPSSFSAEDSTNFGVGLYLIAMSEIVKLTNDYSPVEKIYVVDELDNQYNIAYEKEVTCTGQQIGNESEKLVDGTPYTRWSVESFPQSAVVDLGEIKDVSKFVVYPYKMRRYQYKISVSQDGNSYTEVVDRTENNKRSFMYEDNIKTVKARYVKLDIIGSKDGPGWASITEFKVYN